MQLQLLLDLYMIANLCLILLQHRLVLTGRFVAADYTFTLIGRLITLRIIITPWASSLLPRGLLVVLLKLLLFLHFHVHQDLNACLDVL